MSSLDHRQLKAQASSALSCAAYSPRRLFALHILLSAGLTLLTSFLSYLLGRGIGAAGGLDGIMLRSILQTSQMLLETAVSLALPFWQMGLIYTALRLGRREQAGPGSLLAGFRRLGPTLRLYLLKSLIIILICFVCCYVGLMIAGMTPLANGFYETVQPILETSSEAAMEQMLEDPVMQQQLMIAMLPLLGVGLALTLAVYIPVSYRLRMAEFSLMDDPVAGARAAIKASWRMTKGNCLGLFRLDLSFWWFYALEGLLLVIYSLDTILAELNVALPINADTAFLICCVGYAAGQILLYSWANAQVQTTYATAYDALKPIAQVTQE